MDKVSASEKRRISAALGRGGSKLRVEDVHALISSAHDAGFQAQDRDEILDELASLLFGGGGDGGGGGAAIEEGCPDPKKARTELQNYETLPHFLTETVWQSLALGHLELYHRHLMKLGLRNPSEGTMKVASLVVLCQTEGYQATAEMSAESRAEWMRSLKHMFRSTLRRDRSGSQVLLSCLPSNPRDLPSEIYSVAFDSEGPVQCKLTELQLEHLKLGTRMRVPRGVLGRGVSSSLAIMQPHQMEAALSRQMQQQMFYQQQDMLNMRSQSQQPMSALHGPQFAPPALSLLPGPGIQTQRSGIFGNGNPYPRLALTDGPSGSSSGQLAATQPPDVRSLDAALPEGPASSGAVVEEPTSPSMLAKPSAKTVTQATEEVLPSAKTVAQATQEVLGMMASEKEAARVRKQAVDKSAALDEHPVRPEGKAKGKAKGRAKGKAKGKAKAKAAQGKAKAKAAQGKAKAKAVAKADVKTKGASPQSEDGGDVMHPMPPRCHMPPLYIGECTIYSDRKQEAWRVHHSSNPRADVRYKWRHGSESWRRVLAWVQEHDA